MYNPENKEQFKITPKGVFDVDGNQVGSSDKVLLRSLGYKPFDTEVSFYVEHQDADGNTLRGYNKTIPVPEEWGQDDMVLINAVASSIGVAIEPWPTPVETPSE
jgi:hypothetical protein